MFDLLLSYRQHVHAKTCMLTSGIFLTVFVVVYVVTLSLLTDSVSHFKDGKLHPVVPRMHGKTEVKLHKYLNIFSAWEESEEDRNSVNSNKCVPLHTTVGQTPICIYDPKVDSVISELLDKEGVWETELLYLMASILARNPDMKLLDIGSNIGVFTLQAAKIGRKVIAVDANKQNLRLLSKSLNLGGLQYYVTLVWNAVTDIHETIKLTITPGNVGGAYVKSLDEVDQPLHSNYTVQTATAVTLEDLIDFVKGSPVFMKIDIEGSEWKAFRGGELFFKEVNIRYILMEWGTAYTQGDKGIEIIRHMHTFGFHPYEPSRSKVMIKLETDNYQSWPYDVLWIMG